MISRVLVSKLRYNESIRELPEVCEVYYNQSRVLGAVFLKIAFMLLIAPMATA